MQETISEYRELISEMVNFMGQIDWAMEYPNTRLNMIFGCVCDGVSKWDSFDWWTEWSRLLSAMWMGLTQSMEGLNKAKKVGGGWIHSLPNYLSWDNSLLLFRVPHSQAFKCRLSSVPWAQWSPGLWTASTVLLGLQLAHTRSLNLSALHDCVGQTLTKSLFPYTQKWFSFSNELWGKETRHKSVFCVIPLPWKENR